MPRRFSSLLHADAASARRTPIAQSTIAMDTVITVRVESGRSQSEVEPMLKRSLAWFGEVERACSRFDPESELVRLCRQPGQPVPVSPLLFTAISFALQVAAASHRAFDPAVGGRQVARGIDREYRSGLQLTIPAAPATFRDIHLDRRARTVLLARPLLLDLGGVAKGMAIDLAAQELRSFERYAVDAGGDLYAGGSTPEPCPWRIGIQHPLQEGLLGTLSIWNGAVCSSGGYERPLGQGEHHLLDPRTGRSAKGVAGVTVVTASAMAADALATAAFVGGVRKSQPLLRAGEAEAVFVTDDGTVRATPGCVAKYGWTFESND